MDWPTAIGELSRAFMYVGMAWAGAYTIVGVFRAITR